MNSAAKENFDAAAIQQDLASLKHEFADLVEHVKRTTNQAGRAAVGQFTEEAGRIYHTVADEGRRHASTLSRQVEDQPLTSVLVAFGLGLIASRLFLR